MQYILIEYPDGLQGYQEVSFGNVQRYTTLDGITIDRNPSCTVIDPNPVQPVWALADISLPITVNTPRELTKFIYMCRFTDSELATLYTAAKTVVQIEVWLEKFKLAEVINLDDPATIAGLHALETYGLIAPGRAKEILDA